MSYTYSFLDDLAYSMYWGDKVLSKFTSQSFVILNDSEEQHGPVRVYTQAEREEYERKRKAKGVL